MLKSKLAVLAALLVACADAPVAPHTRALDETFAVTMGAPDSPWSERVRFAVSERDGGFRVAVTAPITCNNGIWGGLRRRGDVMEVIIAMEPFPGPCTTALGTGRYVGDIPASVGAYRVHVFFGSSEEPQYLGTERVVIH